MSEWPMVKLAEVANFVSGGTPNRKIENFYTGKIPWISGADISNSGNIEIRRRITEEAVNQSATNIVSSGTILLVTRTAVGKVSLAPVDLTFSQDITGIFPDKSKVLPQYLEYFIRTTGAKELKRKARGVTIKGISRGDVTDLQIPLPPLEEQKRIAEILSKINYGISKVESEIENLDKLQKSTISNFIISCKTTALEKLATLSGGLSLGSHRKDKPLRVDYLRVANVFWGKISYKDLKTLNCTEKELKRTLLKNGDIVITEAHANRLQVGRSAIIKDLKQTLTFQNHLFRARPNNGINSEILAATLGSTSVRRQLYQMAKTTSGLNTISISQVRSLQIPILDDDKQQGLLEIIQEINKAQHALHQKLALLQELQRSISARAFAGQL